MIILDGAAKPEPVWEFDCDFNILHHATLIKEGY